MATGQGLPDGQTGTKRLQKPQGDPARQSKNRKPSEKWVAGPKGNGGQWARLKEKRERARKKKKEMR